MKTKQLILFIAISIFLQLAIAPLGGYGGHHIKFFAGAVLYMILTIYMLHRFPQNKSVVSLIILIPILIPLVIELFIGFSNGYSFIKILNSIKLSWPSTLAQFGGIIIGFLISKTNHHAKFIIGAVWILFSVWVMVSGYKFWINKLNFGHYFTKVDETIPDFSFSDANGNIFSTQDFSDKTVILEFWFTRCGYCIQDMPHFQKLFNKYRKQSGILFYSVNNPIPDDSIGYAHSILEKYHFNFPLVFASKPTTIAFKVNSYPTYIILDNNRIKYRGGIDGIENYIKSKVLSKNM